MSFYYLVLMMNAILPILKDKMLIVLTENSWLYSGLSLLFSEGFCRQMDFDATGIMLDKENWDNVLIVIDSQILFSRRWETFRTLLSARANVPIVWLTNCHTKRMFPVICSRSNALPLKQNILSLYQALTDMLQNDNMQDNGSVWSGLSKTELWLLPYFMESVSFIFLSRITGIPVKKLYKYRRSILFKTGCRKMEFLQFLYGKNCMSHIADMVSDNKVKLG